jgi:hypothetical protein
MRFEPLTLPLNTSNGFLGDPEDPNSAKRCIVTLGGPKWQAPR